MIASSPRSYLLKTTEKNQQVMVGIRRPGYEDVAWL